MKRQKVMRLLGPCNSNVGVFPHMIGHVCSPGSAVFPGDHLLLANSFRAESASSSCAYRGYTATPTCTCSQGYLLLNVLDYRYLSKHWFV